MGSKDIDAIAAKYGGTVANEVPRSSPLSIDKIAAKYGGQIVDRTENSPLDISTKVAKGAKDPLDGMAQMLYNSLPESWQKAHDKANNWLADNTGLVSRMPEKGGMNALIASDEANYQQRRKDAGEDGFDGWRMTGNIVSPVNLAASSLVGNGMRAVSTLAPKAARMLPNSNITTGAVMGALNPVDMSGKEQQDFMGEKLKQVATGGVIGAAAPYMTGALARVIKPNASANPNLQLLQKEGVNPTIGQTLGGWANRAEEKAQSIPLLGDAIMAARRNAMEGFNQAAINRSLSPIGRKAEQTGQDGIKEAGDAISHYYTEALDRVGHVTMDNQFFHEIGQLKGMTAHMEPKLATRFDNILQDKVLGKLSPNGSLLGETYKQVDSELGNLAGRYGKSSVASEQEFGDSILQLKNLLNQQMRRSNPEVSDLLKQADAAWANLVRVEGAGKLAKNAEGVFTPAQLNSAIQTADQSVRKRAVARGTALMQDLSNAGQQVLGNKYPDSGTAGRVLLGVGTMTSGFANPVIPTGLAAAAALYAPPIQGLLSNMVTKRPEIAGLLADGIRKSTPHLLPAANRAAFGLLGEQP